MEVIEIKEELIVLIEKAQNFPNDVKAAFERLATKVGGFENRTMYGFSYWEDGGLTYLAGCSPVSSEETSALSAETFTVKAGSYISETIKNWEGNEHLFESTFKKLGHAGYVADALGIEWYEGKDVKCMLRIIKE